MKVGIDGIECALQHLSEVRKVASKSSYHMRLSPACQARVHTASRAPADARYSSRCRCAAHVRQGRNVRGYVQAGLLRRTGAGPRVGWDGEGQRGGCVRVAGVGSAAYLCACWYALLCAL